MFPRENAQLFDEQTLTHMAIPSSPFTQSSEPILIPKLRIYFADFPYLRYSNRPEAVHLGDLMRLLVRPRHE